MTRLGAIAIGVAAMHLGAGRRSKDDEIDHAVGVVCRVKRGDQRRRRRRPRRDPRAGRGSAAVAVDEVLAAYELGDTAPPDRDIVLETIA